MHILRVLHSKFWRRRALFVELRIRIPKLVETKMLQSGGAHCYLRDRYQPHSSLCHGPGQLQSAVWVVFYCILTEIVIYVFYTVEPPAPHSSELASSR